MVRFSRHLAVCFLLFLFSGCALFDSTKPARPMPDKRIAAPSQILLAYFPQNPKTSWFYEGFAEYGHRMVLDSVVKNRNQSRIYHNISGWIEDVSSGESNRNFNFKLRYIFTADAVYEEIIQADTPFPHKISSLKLLQVPIKKGTRWQQTIIVNKKKAVLRAEITDIGTEPSTGIKLLQVRYRVPMAGMPGGIYEEVRQFSPGKGIYHFENTFGPNPTVQFNYTLREVKPPGARKVYRNPSFKVLLSYPGEWRRVDEDRYQGTEGFFQVGAIGGGTIDEVCRNEANHKLRPYGSRPEIERIQVRNQPACLILPSTDQPAEMRNQAAVIVHYPQSISISGQGYDYFILYADKFHLTELTSTLEFLP